MNNERLIKLLLEEHETKIMNENDAKLVLDSIQTFIVEEHIEKFIKDDLCVFSEKEHAFNWFFDEEQEGRISSDYADIEITEDMVGKRFSDIMLEDVENYEEINENLYLAWWM